MGKAKRIRDGHDIPSIHVPNPYFKYVEVAADISVGPDGISTLLHALGAKVRSVYPSISVRDVDADGRFKGIYHSIDKGLAFTIYQSPIYNVIRMELGFQDDFFKSDENNKVFKSLNTVEFFAQVYLKAVEIFTEIFDPSLEDAFEEFCMIDVVKSIARAVSKSSLPRVLDLVVSGCGEFKMQVGTPQSVRVGVKKLLVAGILSEIIPRRFRLAREYRKILCESPNWIHAAPMPKGATGQGCEGGFVL